MSLRLAVMVLGLPLALASPAAKAELLHFDFQQLGERTEFNLDSMPVPATSDTASFSVKASNGAEYNGRPVPYFDLIFYTAAAGGGFANLYYPGGPLGEIVDGPQLFSGDTSHPIFSPGTIQVIDPGSGDPVPLVISAVPLPAAAPMFGAALLLSATGFWFMRRVRAAA